MSELRLRPATEGDLPWIVELEWRPDMLAFIGGSDLAEHRDFLANPDFTQIIAEDSSGAPVGYALTEGYVSMPGELLLRRGVTATERGTGSEFLRQLIDDAFAAGRARYKLRVFEDNHRARRLYARFGFVDDPDGAPLQHTRRDGTECQSFALVLYREAWRA